MQEIHLTNKMDDLNLFQSHTDQVNQESVALLEQEVLSSLKEKCKPCFLSLLITGSALTALGFLSIKFTCFDLILILKLKMQPGNLAYDLWVDPKPEIRCNIYIFTVENVNEFLNGTDAKIKLKEIGPIVYREYVHNTDVVFHENSTLSYTAVRSIEFLPHANEPGILNKTITVPNYAILTSAAFINDANLFVKFGFNLIHYMSNESVFKNITIYDYLWNYKTQLLKKAYEIVPFMVPFVNAGSLYNIYNNYTDRYNVRIGTKYGNSQFFLINTMNGAPTAPGYDINKGDCYASVENSTEGSIYRHNLSKDTDLWLWRKANCRKVAFHFEEEVQVGDLAAYKYKLRDDMFDRFANRTSDCYKGINDELPDGLTDISKCFLNLPVATSQPHFYGRSEGFTKKIEGLNANKENHSSFIIVEPKLGIPLVQYARGQGNLVIPKLKGFAPEYLLFSDMILPLYWFEYRQEELTPGITDIVVFLVNILPMIQRTATFMLIFIGYGLAILGCRGLYLRK